MLIYSIFGLLANFVDFLANFKQNLEVFKLILRFEQINAQNSVKNLVFYAEVRYNRSVQAL